MAADILKHRLAPGVPCPMRPCPPGGGREGREAGSPSARMVHAAHPRCCGLWLPSQGRPRRSLLALCLIPTPPRAVPRGLADGWRGWTVALKNGVQWAELAGHDYVLDLVSDLELLRDFPRQKAYFIVGTEGPVAGRAGPRA